MTFTIVREESIPNPMRSRADRVRRPLNANVRPRRGAMRFIARIVVSSLFASAAVAGTTASLPSASVLLSEIDGDGPRVVLRRLWANQPQFEALCSAIESADPNWLEVARRLKPASDAASSLSLNYSVARALPTSPTRVLGLVGRGFGVEDICTSPFIEPEAGVAERYEQRALKALADLSDSALRPVAEQCALRIRLPNR